MPKSKLIVEDDSEVEKQTPSSTAKKTYVFHKNMHFGQEVDLGECGTITFSRNRQLDGGYPTFAIYTTTEAKVAKALGEYAKANPDAFIIEKN